MEDSIIIQQYWARDPDAIVSTQKKYGAYLYTIAQRILSLREDAQESVNDTYLAAWDTIPPQRPNLLQVYLSKLTRHISIDRLRYRTAQKRQPGEYELSIEELSPYLTEGDTTAQALDAKELALAIAAYLDTLPLLHRQIFLRRYFYFDPIAQIADKAGLSLNNTKVILHRLRQNLKQHLQKEGYL